MDIEEASPVRIDTPAIMSAIVSEEPSINEWNHRMVWDEIIASQQEDYKALNDFLKSREDTISVPPHPEVVYLEKEIFPILFPILIKTLKKAEHMDVLRRQRNLFNGIDYIAQCLWNTNEKHPERLDTPNLNIYLMPWVQEFLEQKPRKPFPLSWIISEYQAAIIIQSYVRGYFVRKMEEVQEMRHFWRTLRTEKLYTEAMDLKNQK